MLFTFGAYYQSWKIKRTHVVLKYGSRPIFYHKARFTISTEEIQEAHIVICKIMYYLAVSSVKKICIRGGTRLESLPENLPSEGFVVVFRSFSVYS
jgi:hypothetical protein